MVDFLYRGDWVDVPEGTAPPAGARMISAEELLRYERAHRDVVADLNGRLSDTALSATYVRFEDTAGNPLPSRNVVIKVDAATGEIIDIVSEV